MCSGHNHNTALCKHKKTRRTCQQQGRGYQSPRRSSRHCKCHSSCSPGRQSCCHTPSHSLFHSASSLQHDCSHHLCTPFWYNQDSINVILADRVETTAHPEVSCLWRMHPMVSYPSTPNCSYQSRMGPSS